MKNREFVAKTSEISDKKHLDRLAEKVYNVKEVTEITLSVLSDYIEQVSFMKDEELMQDRNSWMKKFGQSDVDPDYKKDNQLDADIHTIAILLEQVRRFGKIVYDKENDDIRFD
tara:strand:- start:60 stop:401 length:342 start_codon:yes stop_codon:yes gene_type:complete